MPTSNIPVAVRQRARLLATRALRRGELTKEPCSVCGSNNSEMHHRDYTQPLDVVWVCRRHHGMLHRGPNWKPSSGRSWALARWQLYYDRCREARSVDYTL